MKRVWQAEQNFPDLQRDGAALNMTDCAASTYVNGVAKCTAKLRARCFPEAAIEAITNGVHAGTWTSPPFHNSLTLHSIVREDNYSLRSALGLPAEEVWQRI